MRINLIDFQKYNDDRGNLVVAEFEKEIPFTVKRVYYIYGVSGDKKRGFHSHKSLEQIYICINGSCKVKLFDGKDEETVTLGDPSQGLYLGHNIWREIFDFDENAVLLVLASDVYRESDYIRDLTEFKNSL